MINDVDVSVDELIAFRKQKPNNSPKKKRRWKYSIGISSFIVTLVLFFTILLPLFTKQESVNALYGYMPATISNSYEYDVANGVYPDMLRLGTSEYYLVAARMTQGGVVGCWVATLRVWNDNGTIRNSVVDNLRFGNGYYPSICHVSGDVYAISYDDATNTRIRTFTADDADGSIGAAGIDTITLRYLCAYSDIIHVTGNIYAVSYANNSLSQGWLETVYITDAGDIGATTNDTVCFNSTYAEYNNMENIDSNTVALVYDGSSNDGYLTTYNISSTGDITNTWASQWEFDTTFGNMPNIKHVSSNVYSIVYRDAGPNIQIKTVTIDTDGKITKSWIDTLAISIVAGGFPSLFVVNDLSVYGVTYQGTDGDGFVSTFNMSASGSIDASVVDTLEFDAADNIYWAPISWVSEHHYLIVYTGTGNDGWSCGVNITTNYASPTFVNPAPANGSVDIHVTPRCNITINDANGDSMTLTWQENTTGSWVTRQVNSSCSNGTYKFCPFDEASDYSTKYWWKIWCNDGLHNVSNWYYFTTEDEPEEPGTWQVVNSSINGSIKNLTIWKPFSTSINGSIKNVSAWRTFSSSMNGSIKNITLWRAFSTALNGSIKNITIWKDIVPPCGINGSIKNLSGWVTISSSINGSIKNLSYWSAFSTNINGSIKNISAWRTINVAINGSIKNISGWITISSTINGSIKNLTGWVGFSTSINGSIKNISGWITFSSSINGSIKNVSRWIMISSTINGSIKNLSGGITLISYYPLNAATGIPRNVTLRITIQEEAGLPMNITWRRDNYTTYLGSHIDVYNGTYYMLSNASLANHRYNWSFNITNGVNWFNQSQWYQTGNTLAGGGSGGGYTNKRTTTYFVLGACMGTLTGGLVLPLVVDPPAVG